MQRNKTQRRRVTTATEDAAPFMSDTIAKSTEDSLDALIASENIATFQQPWQKLDRGARLDRLRKFVNAYTPADTTYPPLSAAERSSLLTAVLQAFELRQLNSKAMVEYDPATASVRAIKGLRARIAPSGLRTFRIDLAGSATAVRTAKKKVVAATAKTDDLKPSTAKAVVAPDESE